MKRAASVLVSIAILASIGLPDPVHAAISRSQELKSKTFTKLSEGIKTLRDGDPKRAIEMLEEVTSVALNSFRAFYYLGVAYKADRQYTKATKPLSFALELDPTHLQAHVDLGDCYLKRGDIAEALAEYHRSRTIQNAFAPAWDGVARAAEARGDDDEAEINFRKAIELNPGFPDAYLNLGDLYLRRARLSEAVQLFLKAISIRPNFAAAYNRLGVAYSRQRLGNEAIAALRKAAELEKGSPWHPHTIGLIEMELGYYGQALRDFDRSIQLDVNYLEAYEAKARLLRSMGDYLGAIRLLDLAQERPSEEAKLKREIGELRAEIAAQVEQLQDLEARLASGEATAEELRALAGLRADIGDHTGAAEALRLLVDPSPEQDLIGPAPKPAGAADLFRLGYHLLKSGLYGEAEAVFQSARDRRPSSPSILLNLGLCLQGQGKSRAAGTVLQQALALAPDDPIILTALGNARVVGGSLKEAAALFEKALKVSEEFEGRGRVETILRALRDRAEADLRAESASGRGRGGRGRGGRGR
jgi:tetratricopeptide (TPR) repeat protein